MQQIISSVAAVGKKSASHLIGSSHHDVAVTACSHCSLLSAEGKFTQPARKTHCQEARVNVDLHELSIEHCRHGACCRLIS